MHYTELFINDFSELGLKLLSDLRHIAASTSPQATIKEAAQDAARDVAMRNVAMRNVATQDMATQNVATQDMATQDMATQDMATQNVAQDATRNVAAQETAARETMQEAIERSYLKNRFFLKQFQYHALESIAQHMLTPAALNKWLTSYGNALTSQESTVTIIMAGNIPAVGFHDLLSSLAAGYKCNIKLSRRDSYLIPQLIKMLISINPYWSNRIKFIKPQTTILPLGTALIAAGSNATMQHLQTRYSHIPTLLRGSRSSIAILNGNESNTTLSLLCNDIFLYFGLGCRAITKIFIPAGYDFKNFISIAQEKYTYLLDTEDYYSSYRYNRAFMKVAGINIIDGSFFILAEGISFPPPLAVIAIEYYSNEKQISNSIDSIQNKIQIIEREGDPNYLSIGSSQSPAPHEYADRVDTIKFLIDIDIGIDSADSVGSAPK